ncbi:MAG: DUF2259 domain-containing protein [Candidatus Devosia symbiotica]|nr:DUF2259 domain-containing protein [Candidatus Devosia symbiotica]
MLALDRAAVALLVLILAAMPAQAAEFFEVRPISFSADGAVFAFKEFGVQDGSGFPFASQFFIDTAINSFPPRSTATPIGCAIC